MVSENKEKLLELERLQLYLFHGSALELQKLEPRQAYDFRDGVKKKDGVPAVFASHLIDYAIFMAVVNRKNCARRLYASCRFEDEELKFGVSRETLEQLDGGMTGFVHVLKRDGFVYRGDGEWMCEEEVVPDVVLKVSWEDFGRDVQVMEFVAK